MRIGLKQSQHALSNAEAWLMGTADPDSPSYGQYWSQDDVISAFQPSHETVEAVTEWLRSHGITGFTHSDNKQWFAFDITVQKAEEMLETKYFQHQRRDAYDGGILFEATCDRYSLPRNLSEHVDFITPGIRSSDVTGRTAWSRRYFDGMSTFN